MANHTVTAPMVVVFDDANVQHYVNRGAKVPEFVSPDHVKLLLDAGLVEKEKASRSSSSKPSTPSEPPSDKPVAEMTGPELKAFAAQHEIDLAGVTKVDDIRSAILASPVVLTEPTQVVPEPNPGDDK